MPDAIIQEVDDISYADEIEKIANYMLANKDNISAALVITRRHDGGERVEMIGSAEDLRSVHEHSSIAINMALAAVPTEKREVN